MSVTAELFRPDLVASDLDGTLLTPELEILARAAPTRLPALAAAGVPFLICTGRMFRSARRVAAQLGLTARADRLLPGGHGRRPGHGTHACCTGRIDGARGGRGRASPARPRPPPQRLHRRPSSTWSSSTSGRGATPSTPRWASRSWTTSPPKSRRGRRPSSSSSAIRPTWTCLLPQLQEEWRGRLYVARSQASYIELAAPGVSKSGALQWLCDRQGSAARAHGRLRRRPRTTSTCCAGRGWAWRWPRRRRRCACAADLVVARAGPARLC